jgi:hypothetical protein
MPATDQLLYAVEFDEKFYNRIRKSPQNVRRYWKHKERFHARRLAYYAVPEHKVRAAELRDRWVKENPERLKETRKKYYEREKKAILARQAAWYLNHAEKVAGWSRRYYLKHKEEIKARTAEYRRTHGDTRKRTSKSSGSSNRTKRPAEGPGAGRHDAPVGTIHVG